MIERLVSLEGKWGVRISEIVNEFIAKHNVQYDFNVLHIVAQTSEILEKNGYTIDIIDQSKIDKDFKMPECDLYYCVPR